MQRLLRAEAHGEDLWVLSDGMSMITQDVDEHLQQLVWGHLSALEVQSVVKALRIALALRALGALRFTPACCSLRAAMGRRLKRSGPGQSWQKPLLCPSR